MALTPEFRKKYEFDWQILDVIIGGKSAIDNASGLFLKTPEDAVHFLECYGFDLENPIEKAELFGNFQESIQFIRHYFLRPENPEGLDLEIPRKILEITDITQLLTMASAGGGSGAVSPAAAVVGAGHAAPVVGGASHAAPQFGAAGHAALWACSVIKLMHTINHMDKDLGAYYFTDVQKQILDRFYKFIHSDEASHVFLGKDARDPDRVDLVLFESKPKKSRDSVILKLLHKPENVAEDIFDRVGIRFVTRNRLDSLRVVKFLKERYVIMPANIKPSRSRNTLIDEALIADELPRLLALVEEGGISASELDARIAGLFMKNDIRLDGPDNPHTSKHYRSIQFTGRQLIKFKNPIYDELKALKKAVKGKTCPDEIVKIADRLDLGNIQKETRFFYPFEVQIYDEASHKENLAGRSSHSNYKRSQIRTAMRRVLGPLMGTERDAKDQG
ncbi:MAG: TIGR04552 family protein [Deltaproteobacteria bacterium]|nr:TIGR04552 family protein [Deltaproteobacteria bacterium]